MFIIKQGYGYEIDGNEAFKIDFDENGNIFTTEDKIKVEKSDVQYTYEEMYRKLNIRYFATLKKMMPKTSTFKSKKSDKIVEDLKQNKD